MPPTPTIDNISEAGLFFPEDGPRLEHWRLALQSAKIPYAVEWDEGSPVLVVPSEYTEAARQELASYDYNNIDWPPEPIKEPLEHAKTKPLATIASLEAALASLVMESRRIITSCLCSTSLLALSITISETLL